eukprot:2890890-Prymnesium_polylepis.2
MSRVHAWRAFRSATECGVWRRGGVQGGSDSGCVFVCGRVRPRQTARAPFKGSFSFRHYALGRGCYRDL